MWSVCFIGDFGGYFGLFLGGSAISLFEILDLILYNCFVKITARKVQPQQKVINVQSVEGQQN